MGRRKLPKLDGISMGRTRDNSVGMIPMRLGQALLVSRFTIRTLRGKATLKMPWSLNSPSPHKRGTQMDLKTLWMGLSRWTSKGIQWMY